MIGGFGAAGMPSELIDALIGQGAKDLAIVKRAENASFMTGLDVATALPRARLLDLGCGMGQLAVHLAEAGAAEVIGVDAEEDRIVPGEVEIRVASSIAHGCA